jgi:type IX secretion system substrate protein
LPFNCYSKITACETISMNCNQHCKHFLLTPTKFIIFESYFLKPKFFTKMKKIYFLTMFLFSALMINAQTMVTFAVDMNEVDAAEFDPATDVMKIGGDFQGWSPDDTVMEDTDGNGVYAVTVEVSEATIAFKYVINAWETNEFHPDTPGVPGDCTVDDGGGNINRSEDIPAGDPYSIPVYKYNTCDVSDLGPTAVKELTTIQNLKITPNPTSGIAVITFSNSNNANHNVTIASVTGQVVKRYSNVSGTNLEIDTQNLTSGMYFVTFQNELGELGTEKLIVR